MQRIRGSTRMRYINLLLLTYLLTVSNGRGWCREAASGRMLQLSAVIDRISGFDSETICYVMTRLNSWNATDRNPAML